MMFFSGSRRALSPESFPPHSSNFDSGRFRKPTTEWDEKKSLRRLAPFSDRDRMLCSPAAYLFIIPSNESCQYSKI